MRGSIGAIDGSADLWRLQFTATPGAFLIWHPRFSFFFKSQATRPQDLADFECVLPRLDRAACAWLKGALAQNDPHHSWLPFLEQRLPATGSVS